MSTKCWLSTDRWSLAFRGAETYDGFPGYIKIIKKVNTSEFGDYNLTIWCQGHLLCLLEF